MTASALSAPWFHDEAAAYRRLESFLWPQGPYCPRCGGMDRITKVGRNDGADRALALRSMQAPVPRDGRNGFRVRSRSTEPLASGRAFAVQQQEGHEQPSNSPHSRRDLQNSMVHDAPIAGGNARGRFRRPWWRG